MAPTLDSTTQTFLHSHDLVRRFIFHIEYGGKDLEDRVARLDEVMRRHSLWEGVMLKKVISFRKDLKGEQDRAMFEEFREEGERNGREELGHLSQRFPGTFSSPISCRQKTNRILLHTYRIPRILRKMFVFSSQGSYLK